MGTTSETIRSPALLLGSKPELLHHAQIIVALPLLDYLASSDAVNGDAFKLYLSASGRAKHLCLSLVDATGGVAPYHLLTFGYHVLVGHLGVGEGRKERGGQLLGLLVASDVLIRSVPDEVGRVELFYEVRVLLVHDLRSAKCYGLVLFRRHRDLLSPLLLSLY